LRELRIFFMNFQFEESFSDEGTILLELLIPRGESKKEDDYRISIYLDKQFDSFFVTLDSEPFDEEGDFLPEERIFESDSHETFANYHSVFENLNDKLVEFGFDGLPTEPVLLFRRLRDSIVEKWGVKQLRYLHEVFNEDFPQEYPIIIDPERTYEEHLELVQNGELPEWAKDYTEEEYNGILDDMYKVACLAPILDWKNLLEN